MMFTIVINPAFLNASTWAIIVLEHYITSIERLYIILQIDIPAPQNESLCSAQVSMLQVIYKHGLQQSP